MKKIVLSLGCMTFLTFLPFSHQCFAQVLSGCGMKMGVGRASFAATVLNGKIFVIGGYFNSRTTAEVYDPNIDKWSYLPDMKSPRTYETAQSYNGKVYVFGDRFGASVEVYDPATDSWTFRKPLPSGTRFCAASALLNDKIYVIGGETGGPIVNLVDVYDPATDEWGGEKELPEGVSGHGAVVLNGKIYVIGGYTPSYSNKVWIFDPQTHLWTPGPPLNTARYYFGATVLDGKIYVIGGGSDGKLLDSIEVLDPSKNYWEYDEFKLTTPRDRLQAVTANNTLYAIGGANEDPPVTELSLLQSRLDLPTDEKGHGGTVQVPGIPYDNFNKINWKWLGPYGDSPLWSGNVTQNGSDIVLTVKDGCGVGAEIDSAGQEYHYGEYRARIKTVPGTSCPDCNSCYGVCQAFFYHLTDTSEIDVEILSADPDHVHFTVHADYDTHFRVYVPNQADAPHGYGFRWTLGRVEFLLDGKKARGQEVDGNSWSTCNPRGTKYKDDERTAEVISPDVPTGKGQLMLNNYTGRPWPGEPPNGIGDQNMTIFSASVYSLSYVGQSGQCADRSPCFSSIQDAVDSAQVATIIDLIQQTYYENPLLDNPNVIFIRGGWDPAFTTNESYSAINGSLTITDGTLIVENIILQ